MLRSKGEDRFGQIVTASTSVAVSDDEDRVKLRFFADSSTGKVGSKLAVRLHSRIGNALALMTFEGEEILSHRIIELKEGYNDVDLTPGHEHFPNFRLSVAAIDERDLRAAHKDFTIERELKLRILPRKAVESPGAEALVDVVVTDQNGKPVEAAFSVALVNQALYALYSDSVSPILDFFQSSARRNAEFRISSTCGFSYQGRTDKVVKSITEEKKRLERRQMELTKLKRMRQDGRYGMGEDMFSANTAVPGASRDFAGGVNFFAKPGSEMVLEEAVVDMQVLDESARLEVNMDDAVLKNRLAENKNEGKAPLQARKEIMNASRWISPVITDAEGKATIKIPLPESTSEWRLTARACTIDTLVGQATSTLITRKDFFVELKTPVLAQEGDFLRQRDVQARFKCSPNSIISPISKVRWSWCSILAVATRQRAPRPLQSRNNPSPNVSSTP